MKRILPLLALGLVLLNANLLSARTFEGTVTMQMSSGRDQALTLLYSVKAGLLRIDTQVSPQMTATAILDLAKDEMIMLMPGQAMYMVMPIQKTAEDATGHSSDDVTLENTGITEEILGYTCTKYLAKSKEGVTEIWATDELGVFMGLSGGMGGPMGKSQPAASWEKALKGKDFFPLRVVGDAKGKKAFRLEATAVERKSLPDAHFAPPPGHRKFDMGGMMQGMGNLPFNR